MAEFFSRRFDQASSLRELVLSRRSEPLATRDETADLSTPYGRLARVVAVSSGKGGVGKTSLAVNLGLALQELGRRVALVDADLGMANVDILMGLVPQYHLGHVADGTCTLEQALCRDPDGLLVLPGASGLMELASMRGEALQRLLGQLRRLDRLVDVMLIDTGAGIGEQVMAFLQASPEVIVVATPEPTSVTDAYGLVKVLTRTRSAARLHLVVNMCRNADEGMRVAGRLKAVAGRFLGVELSLLGAVPHDPAVSRAVLDQVPLLRGWPRSPAARGVREVARRLLELPAVTSGGGLSGALRRMVRLTR
ncbi:MAG: MinD/ParA family protein [Bacillota bacterium]